MRRLEQPLQFVRLPEIPDSVHWMTSMNCFDGNDRVLMMYRYELPSWHAANPAAKFKRMTNMPQQNGLEVADRVPRSKVHLLDERIELGFERRMFTLQLCLAIA